MKRTKALFGIVAVIGLTLSGCGRKSEGEQARDDIERGIENVEDGLTKDGPKEDAREAREQMKDEIEDRKD